jgi:ligand-binding sensor domain-containing protein
MKILLGTFTFFICIQLFGQQRSAAEVQNFNPRFEVFNLPGDIFGNSVQGMVQDNSGFLWFATQGGLFRYDGQNFITYRHDSNNPNSLAADYIESVFLDSKGLLWLTHWQAGALTAFDIERGVFTRYQHDPNDPESLSGNVLSTVAEDHQGFIWVGGSPGLTGTILRPEFLNVFSMIRIIRTRFLTTGSGRFISIKRVRCGLERGFRGIPIPTKAD